MNDIVQASPAVMAGEPQQYLTFMLSGEPYAINIQRIKETIQYGELTEVPRMPDFIRGVINLRGAVVPVIDLRTCRKTKNRYALPSTWCNLSRCRCRTVYKLV